MKHYILFCSAVLLCSLSLLLTACAQNSSSIRNNGDGTGVATAVSTTSTYATAIPSPSAAASIAFALYRGEGYSIKYPKAWKVTKSANAVTFSDEKNAADLVVQLIPNPNGVIQPEKAVATELNSLQKSGKNYRKLAIPSTATLNGVTWFQSGASADIQYQGHLQSGKMITLATNHPAHVGATTLFSIMYTSDTPSFDSNDSTIFQPMLQSFKFS